MKTMQLFLLFFFLMAGPALAAPFLVSDPAPDVVGGGSEIWENAKGMSEALITTTGTMIYSGNNQPDGSIRYDLGTYPIGIKYWYIRYWTQTTWLVNGVLQPNVGGKNYSVFRPFSLERTGFAPGPTKGERLVAQ